MTQLLGLPALFATSYMIGLGDKETNNRTTIPPLKNIELLVIRVQLKQSFRKRCRSIRYMLPRRVRLLTHFRLKYLAHVHYLIQQQGNVCSILATRPQLFLFRFNIVYCFLHPHLGAKEWNPTSSA